MGDKHQEPIEREQAVDDAPSTSNVGPSDAPVPGILGLQRSAGNRITNRVLAKLEVGAADDPCERAADDVADRVVRALRARDVGGAQGSVGDETESTVRRSGKIQRAATGPDGGPLSEDATAAIDAALRRGGKPLPSDAQQRMGGAFGADFSGVRVHSGGQSDALNDRLGAKAFTLGRDVFFKGGVPDSSTGEGQRLLAHELTHTIQQGGAQRIAHRSEMTAPQPVVNESRIRPMRTSIQREDGDVTVVKRSDHTETLKAIAAAVVPAQVATGRTKVRNYLANGLGAKGVHFWRSSELKAFRIKMKSAARVQAYDDIDEFIQEDEAYEDVEMIKSQATMDFVAMASKDDAYKSSKKAVNARMLEMANAWMKNNWQTADLIDEINMMAMDAAWAVLKANPDKKRKAAQKAALATTKHAVKNKVLVYSERARTAKNSMIKPDQEDEDNQEMAASEQDEAAAMVATDVAQKKVGQKSVKKVIKAMDAGGALRGLGALLDQVIPMPGEQVSLSVDFQIPIPAAPGTYITIKLAGKAGRGITGFSTSGVTTLGEKNRLEIMSSLSLGAGAEAFGLKADLSVGFFTRAGSDKGTGPTMSALSYGIYRAMTAKSEPLANFWAGSGKGTELPAVQRAEMWAAAIESNVFAEDENAFVDLGGNLAAEMGANFGVFEAAISGGAELFKRYDQDSLGGEDSLGAKLGAAVMSPEEAKQRRAAVKGLAIGSVGLAAKVNVKINGQGVSFAGSYSHEHSTKTEALLARNNWGVEISAGIGMAPGTMTAVEKIASGIVNASVGIVQSLVAAGKKDKAIGPAADIVADVTQIIDAGLETQISTALGDLWKVDGSLMDNAIGDSTTPIEAASGIGTGSELSVAITFGKTGGQGVFRFELRSSKSMDVKFGLGSVGVTVSASKGRRLLALGYEDEAFVLEAIGLRAGKNQ